MCSPMLFESGRKNWFVGFVLSVKFLPMPWNANRLKRHPEKARGF